MKSIQKKCEICETRLSQIPLLTCGHFVCSVCYCKLKAVKLGCPTCGKILKRDLRGSN